MKVKFAAVLSVMFVVGCSSVPTKEGIEPGNITAINAQTLTSTFSRNSIKVEWDCMFGTGFSQTTCVQTKIKSITVTGYAPSFGSSEVARESAFKVSHDVALDKMIRFIKQDINSSRVTTTMAKNIEKAADRTKTRIAAGDEVSMSDTDASNDTNYAVRENTNDTVRNLTEVIRTQASGIIRGAQIVDEKIVDRQTVATTIKWDAATSNAVRNLRKQFSTN
jgi:hypothetical protein